MQYAFKSYCWPKVTKWHPKRERFRFGSKSDKVTRKKREALILNQKWQSDTQKWRRCCVVLLVIGQKSRLTYLRTLGCIRGWWTWTTCQKVRSGPRSFGPRTDVHATLHVLISVHLAEKWAEAELCQCNTLKLEDISSNICENQGAGACLIRPQKGLNLNILLYETLKKRNLMSGSVLDY